MMVADTRRFDFENGRSVQPNNPSMLCGRISDTGLYSFSYQRMGMGPLLKTVFNWSLAVVRFMMNKSVDQKPEVNIVIRFHFLKQGIDKMS